MYQKDRKDTGQVSSEAPFESLEQYMKDKHIALSRDYITDSGGAESCTVVTFDVALLLTKEGKHPTIGQITGVPVDSDFVIRNEALVPRQYNGNVTWGGHTVCVCDGQVYDPMVSSIPVPESEYTTRSFENDSVVFKPDEMDFDQIKRILKL